MLKFFLRCLFEKMMRWGFFIISERKNVRWFRKKALSLAVRYSYIIMEMWKGKENFLWTQIFLLQLIISFKTSLTTCFYCLLFGVLHTLRSSKNVVFNSTSSILRIFKKKIVTQTQQKFGRHLWTTSSVLLHISMHRKKDSTWKRLSCKANQHDHIIIWLPAFDASLLGFTL